MSSALAEFNALPTEKAFAQALHFCGSESWADSMVAGRPFGDVQAVHAAAERLWAAATRQDRREAFAAHPLIGDVAHLRQKFATVARSEQGRVMAADEQVLAELAKLNQAYFDRHGFIFIIFATGKSAAQMLAALQSRLDNSTADEIENASAEQAKITRLRINQTFLGD